MNGDGEPGEPGEQEDDDTPNECTRPELIPMKDHPRECGGGHDARVPEQATDQRERDKQR